MKRALMLWFGFGALLGLWPPLAQAAEPSPGVSEACEVLRHFRGEFSYGGWGLLAQANDGEVAAWIIFHSPNPASKLVELFPECERSGKAYVLAALFRADRKAFYSLTNEFCQEPGDIITASGCIGASMTRMELVKRIQQSTSTFAFNPKQKPRRDSSLAFFGSSRDVYEARRREQEERRIEHERGEAALRTNPKLGVFTNAFKVEDAREFAGCYSGVYFSSTNSWTADLTLKVPRRFSARAAIIFANTNNAAEVGLTPDELLRELQDISDLPFLRDLDRELQLKCVTIAAAGDRLHWDTKEASRLAQCLGNETPIMKWVQFSVNCGSPTKRIISFFHPQGTDIYVVEHWLFESPSWRQQYTSLTGRKPKRMKELDTWFEPDPPCVAVVNGNGQLQLFPLQATTQKSTNRNLLQEK